MDQALRGQKALVTGASSGIGEGIAPFLPVLGLLTGIEGTGGEAMRFWEEEATAYH